MSKGKPKSLGEKASLASLLADTFVTSRLTVAFILACALIGAWALVETPRQDNPRIVVPAARISVEMPGATPAEIEALVVLQRKAFRFEEVEVRMRPRKAGRSTITPLKSPATDSTASTSKPAIVN